MTTVTVVENEIMIHAIVELIVHDTQYWPDNRIVQFLLQLTNCLELQSIALLNSFHASSSLSAGLTGYTLYTAFLIAAILRGDNFFLFS